MIVAAFTAGLITSLHCVGMCGPLACAVCPKQDEHSSRWLCLPLYHTGRLISYTLLGGLLGWAGNSIRSFIPTQIPEIIPWAFIALFLIIFLGLEKRWALPDWPWMIRLRMLLPAPSAGPATSFLLGVGTPLLPCGPLYLIFGLALVSGSAFHGAIMMALFALGTIPLILLLQGGMIHWQGVISPIILRQVQRGLAFIALGLMIWRVSVGEPLQFGETPCPFCH